MSRKCNVILNGITIENCFEIPENEIHNFELALEGKLTVEDIIQENKNKEREIKKSIFKVIKNDIIVK